MGLNASGKEGQSRHSLVERAGVSVPQATLHRATFTYIPDLGVIADVWPRCTGTTMTLAPHVPDMTGCSNQKRLGT